MATGRDLKVMIAMILGPRLRRPPRLDPLLLEVLGECPEDLG